MSFKIQRVPLGLPSFLRVYGGEGPRDLANEAVYTIDATPYYSATTLLGTSGVATVGAVLNLTNTVVFGQPVRLRQVGTRYVQGAAAGTNLNLSCGIVLPVAGSPSHAYDLVSVPVMQIGEVILSGVELDLVVPAGATVFARASGTAAGADHALQVTAVFDQLL